MSDRVIFSGQHLQPVDIAKHHADVNAALKLFFSQSVAEDNRIILYKQRLEEENKTALLSLLIALEASFRIDYLLRVYRREKDPLSRHFRNLYKEKGPQVSLDSDILQAWGRYSDASKRLIGNLKSVFRYRHWLAYGRYWVPKLGQRYDYNSIYILVQTIIDSFPLFTQ